jgi:hypothetical protein
VSDREVNRGSPTAAPAVAPPSFAEQDDAGVDLSLVAETLRLSPLGRLRLMERKARETRILNEYGRRHREACTRPNC